MQDIEKLGLFYLGRLYDTSTGRTLEEPVLYDSRDLVTHAVCVGMTGSGKTGLCLSLIEEAAIDGVPVLAIDPKGDLTNLLLTFPALAAENFRPWIDEDEARRRGETPEVFAAGEAERWRAGLAEWGEDGARIERLRKAAQFAIYTPGSRAGLPVSILSSFAAPPLKTRSDSEALAERAGSTATSVLTLAGVDAAPRSREHTLLASLFSVAWTEGRDLDLAGLIQQVQSPPFQKIGVIDLEAFFPSKDRFDLAMRLNNLLAAPGFSQWLEGAPLDPASLLYTADGKPRVAIFSIAHLGDAERMFFVSLLLNQVVAWMRGLTGTTSLRALLYMDEIFGYFPPVAAPPSKPPLMTLLKQARAFGLGIVLATQNPVDLDYKGLANTGTWFLGRLQTERDKARMLDGLEGAAAGSMDRAEVDRLLSALGKRVFLLHNVHEKAPVVFQSRWALSYLRGPLSRDQIQTLMAGAAERQSTPASSKPAAVDKPGMSARGPSTVGSTEPPVLPPGIQQFFIPRPFDRLRVVPSSVESRAPSPESRAPSPESRAPSPDPSTGSGSSRAPSRDEVHYTPVVLGAARVGFGDAKQGIDEVRDVVYVAALSESAIAVDWATAIRLDVAPSDLRTAPEAGATFAPVPPAGLQAKKYAGWGKDLGRWLAQSEKLELMRQRDLKLTSRPEETERDFKVRVQDALRAARDEAVSEMRKKFAAKQAQIGEQLRRAEVSVEKESAQATQQKLQTTVSVGATILGALFGRKSLGVGTVGRATTAARGVGRSMKEADDIRRATENLDAVRERERALEEEIVQETRRITEAFDARSAVERISLTPKRGQTSIQLIALGWLPQ
jgi:Helicase HerA, central domain